MRKMAQGSAVKHRAATLASRPSTALLVMMLALLSSAAARSQTHQDAPKLLHSHTTASSGSAASMAGVTATRLRGVLGRVGQSAARLLADDSVSPSPTATPAASTTASSTEDTYTDYDSLMNDLEPELRYAGAGLGRGRKDDRQVVGRADKDSDAPTPPPGPTAPRRPRRPYNWPRRPRAPPAAPDDASPADSAPPDYPPATPPDAPDTPKGSPKPPSPKRPPPSPRSPPPPRPPPSPRPPPRSPSPPRAPPSPQPPSPRPPPSPPRPPFGGGVDKGTVGPSGTWQRWPPRPPPPSPSPQVQPRAESVDPDSPIDPAVLLEAHNAYRRLAGAPDLRWDAGLAAQAQAWAEQCSWQHSKSGAGENLAAGNYRTPQDTTRPVGLWYNEICSYDFNNPGFSMLTGHYTQVVWASTTLLGCGYHFCGTGNVPGLDERFTGGVLVCQYRSAGNIPYASYFNQNVRKPSEFPPQCPSGFRSG